MGVDLGNLSALRTFRVLRALKTVAVIPGMGWYHLCLKRTNTSINSNISWNLECNFIVINPTYYFVVYNLQIPCQQMDINCCICEFCPDNSISLKLEKTIVLYAIATLTYIIQNYY